jgi:hypothetical protein
MASFPTLLLSLFILNSISIIFCESRLDLRQIKDWNPYDIKKVVIFRYIRDSIIFPTTQVNEQQNNYKR